MLRSYSSDLTCSSQTSVDFQFHSGALCGFSVLPFELLSMEVVDISAESYFKRVGVNMKMILGDDSSAFENDLVDSTIELIGACGGAVEREFLISKNEQFDDISTATLKYFFLDYYEAKCHQAYKGMEDRLNNVLSAKSSYNLFLQKCTQFGLLHESDRDGTNLSAMSADQKRNHKIEKYKRDRAAKARINEIQRLLYIARKDDAEVEHEGELRELYLTQAQCYAREAVDDLDMLQQEMAMLRYQAEQQREQDSRGDGGAEGGSGDHRVNNNRSKPSAGGMYLDNYTNGPPHQQGPGISVTRTFKVGDQIMFSRETVKSSVYGSHIAAPTMSLEEYGDQVKAEAIEREERSQRDANSTDSAARNGRRYKQLEADGDEDDADLADQAADKDRAWDDWKDNNPRGWGNKMGKRF